MSRIQKLLAVWLLVAASSCFAQEMPEGRLMRFPDIYKDRIVFSYAGDLWLVPSAGGVARRITTHPGLELFPKFSPDGKWIAYTYNTIDCTISYCCLWIKPPAACLKKFLNCTRMYIGIFL